MKQDSIETGTIYHYFNKGNNGEDIFFEEKNYHYFLFLIQKHLLPIADVFCYCLMKNHYHILLKIKEKEFIEDKYKEKPYLPISNLFNAYSKSINKAYNRKGSLFQEHPKRNRVNDDSYFKQLVSYIHLNPIKHNFVTDLNDYPFSSFHYYANNSESFINRDFMFNIFDGIEEFNYWHDIKQVDVFGKETENFLDL